MNNIRVIVTLYEDYSLIWDLMLSFFLAVANDQKIQQFTSDLKNKIYASYLEALRNFFEMKENNPDWKDTFKDIGSQNTPNHTLSLLLDEMETIAIIYSERKKLLDMLSFFVSVAYGEKNINPYFISHLSKVENIVMELYWDSLLAFRSRELYLTYLRERLEDHFDEELLQIMKEMVEEVESWDYSALV